MQRRFRRVERSQERKKAQVQCEGRGDDGRRGDGEAAPAGRACGLWRLGWDAPRRKSTRASGDSRLASALLHALGELGRVHWLETGPREQAGRDDKLETGRGSSSHSIRQSLWRLPHTEAGHFPRNLH